MKQKMYSAQSNSYLHDHILDGFAASHEGIRNLKDQGIIPEQEYTALLEKNIARLVDRVREFRIMEKMVCIFFAMLFSWMQTGVDDLEMRRPTRSRTSTARARNKKLPQTF